MKHLHFRGQNYDVDRLVCIAGQGHRLTVDTKDIIDLIAVPSFSVRVAVLVEGKYHLLTGAIDKKEPACQVQVLSKVQLKKALKPEQSYGDRREDARQERAYEPNPAYGRFQRDPSPGQRRSWRDEPQRHYADPYSSNNQRPQEARPDSALAGAFERARTPRR